MTEKIDTQSEPESAERRVVVVGGRRGAATKPERPEKQPAVISLDDKLEDKDAEGSTSPSTNGGRVGLGFRRAPGQPGHAASKAFVRFATPEEQPRWLVPVLAGVTALAVVMAVVFGLAWSNVQSQQQTRTTVERVSKDFLLALTNFKPTTVDADMRTLFTYATGNFLKQADQLFDTSTIQGLENAQASSEGQIRYLATQNLTDDSASVYAEVDQTYANNKLSTPVSDVLQVAISLTDTSAGWKISAVTVLQPPASAGAPTGNAGSATGG